MPNELASQRGKAQARKDLAQLARCLLRPDEDVTDFSLEFVRLNIVNYPGNIDNVRKNGQSVVGSDFADLVSPIEFDDFVEGYVSSLLQPIM